jgi:ABC-type multidrug transport system fused ATPase/permease subunit
MTSGRPFLALYRSLSPRRRRHLFGALAAMLVGAAAELLTIGAALAFIALVADPGSAIIPAALVDRLDLPGGGPVLGASLLLGGAALLLLLVRLGLLWVSTRFVTALGRDIATTIFGRMLRQPYTAYLERNSSELIAGVEKVQRVIFQVLQPAMQGFIAAVLALFVAGLLFVIDAFAATIAAVLVFAAYAGVSLATRRRLRANSEAVAAAVTAGTRVVREGLGGIRDILLDRSQPLFEARFAALEASHRHAQASTSFIAAAPRFVVETAGIIALALVALLMSLEPGGIASAIPILGALALGAQRLLPLIQQAWLGWSHVAGSSRMLEEVVALMELPIDPVADAPPPGLAFEHAITFEGVYFRYPGGREALGGVSLRIARGERVGICGTTGGGKTTLLDLLMGLLEPRRGEVRVDGRPLTGPARIAWQAKLAHVPQSVYLADDSIAANIAFGEAEPDEERIRAAARMARVEAFVEELPEGYATRVGDRGVRLSGGQRQRIGLARALYKGAEVLILDEATSALDDATQAEVIGALGELSGGVTIVMVAHRASSLALCDRTIRIEAGRIA